MKFGFILTRNDQDVTEKLLFEEVAILIKSNDKNYSGDDILELIDNCFGSDYRVNLISRYKDHLKHYSESDNKELDAYVNSYLIEQVINEFQILTKNDKLNKIKFWLKLAAIGCIYVAIVLATMAAIGVFIN